MTATIYRIGAPTVGSGTIVYGATMEPWQRAWFQQQGVPVYCTQINTDRLPKRTTWVGFMESMDALGRSIPEGDWMKM